MSVRYDCSDPASRRRGLDQAVRALGDGELVVVPTDTGYALAADAFRPGLPEAFADAKGLDRAVVPPLFVADVRTLDGVATGIPDAARALVRAWWPGPLSLVARSQPTLDWSIGAVVTVRAPLHAVALELLTRTGPLAATGAGTGEPVATCVRAQELLGEAVGVYLDAGPVDTSRPSTVLDVRGEPVRVIREGALTGADLERWTASGAVVVA